MGSVDVGIHQLSIEIQPDLPVLPAVEGTAGHRPVRIDRAAEGFPIHVDAVTVVALVNEIGLAEIPVNDPLPDVLAGQGKGDAAAGPATEAEAARASEAYLLAEGVLVILRVLEHDAHALPLEFLRQPLPYGLFPPVKLLDGDQSLLNQKLDKGVKEGSRLQRLGGVRAQATVGVKETRSYWLAEPKCGLPDVFLYR